MRVFLMVLSALFMPSLVVAEANALFEAKTATQALENNVNRDLSSNTNLERGVKKTASLSNHDASTAYMSCPGRPRRARGSLNRSVRDLLLMGRLLSLVTAGADEEGQQNLKNLQALHKSTEEAVAELSRAALVCDTGAVRLQSELSYESPPGADFVRFAKGWGNMGVGAHGTFGIFSPGATAPDHLHSHTYYGVVISGILKNPFGDSPSSAVGEAKPLPTGSFWGVPAESIHTTGCEVGERCMFYFHARDYFDFDVDVNTGMLQSGQELAVDEILAGLETVSPFARMNTVWGDRASGAHGTVAEFLGEPLGISPPHTHSFSYHGVVLAGEMVNPFLGMPVDSGQRLTPGDYWFVPAGVEHVTACVSTTPCLFYFHSEGLFDFLPIEE